MARRVASIEKGVADGIVAAIRSHERNGLVELPKPPRLKRGDRVQIVQVPFREHLALYVGQTSPERVAVLPQLLGGQQRAELPADAIEPLRSGVMTLPEAELSFRGRRQLEPTLRSVFTERVAGSRMPIPIPTSALESHSPAFEWVFKRAA